MPMSAAAMCAAHTIARRRGMKTSTATVPTATGAPVLRPELIPPQQLPLLRLPELIHMSQYPGSTNRDARTSDNANCGPTSVVNALRLVGLDAPGFELQKSQQAIDAVRFLADGAGSGPQDRPTSPLDIVRAIDAVGGGTRYALTTDELLRAVRDGRPAIAGGYSSNATWRGDGDRAASDARLPVGHFIVVSEYQPSTGMFLVNGPEHDHVTSVTKEQIHAFRTNGGEFPDTRWPAFVVQPTPVSQEDVEADQRRFLRAQ